MNHRAAQIVDAIAALVRARVEANGTKVYTHRRLTLDPEQDELPAISVDFGEDSRSEMQTLGSIDSTLSVQCTAVVSEPLEAVLRETLLELRAETHRAVMANPRLGLLFVNATTYGGASAPEFSVDAGRLVGELTSTWLVHYEMSLSDPAN